MATRPQFIYVLTLIPSLLMEENWTQRDEEIVNRHFQQLKGLAG